MDAQHFKAPYLRRTDIWQQADELRQRPLPRNTHPVPVLDSAEFDLGLELDPRANLRRAGDIDALLLPSSSDFLSISSFVITKEHSDWHRPFAQLK